MRGSLRDRVIRLTVLWAVGCGEAQVKGPASGGPGAVNPERPGGGGAPAQGGSGGGVTLPDPPAMPPPPPAGMQMQCAAEAHRAEIVALDLMLLVDSSSSMNDMAGMLSKWETAQAALKSFVLDPKSAGLGVGLQFFPENKHCMTDADCFPSAATTDRYCTGPRVCAGPAGPAPMASTCGPRPFVIVGPAPVTQCPMGTTCQPVGRCSLSAADCTNLGQPCDMGGGTCEVLRKTCSIGAAVNCDEARYQLPAVAIQPLPMGQAGLTRILDSKVPSGGTPMGPAVRGVLAHLRARLMADPARKVALVVASDGLPGGCQRTDIPSIAADLSAAFTGPPSIPTYVIGVFSPGELASARPQLDQLAMGGGTGQAFVLSATDDLNRRLLEALDQIRGAALACEYRIPPPQAGKLDFAKVNVRYLRGAPGGPENIPYVERMERCDPTRGGWYYDVHPSMGTPARVMVCPTTCDQFKKDPAGGVELVFGCATRVID